MRCDEVIGLGSVVNLGHWTSAGFRLVRFEATHLGRLGPTAGGAAGARRRGVFDRSRGDTGATPSAGAEGGRRA